MPGPTFSILDIPFSYRGSWLDISPVIAEKTYAEDLHLVSHQTGLHPVLRLCPVLDGDPVATTVIAQPSHLTWQQERLASLDDGTDEHSHWQELARAATELAVTIQSALNAELRGTEK